MNHQVSTKLNYNNEIDLIGILTILIKEKKLIVITFIVITLLSLGGALYERKISKKVSAIFTIEETWSEQGVLIPSVMEKVYRENDIRNINKLSLDEFRNQFKITGIIPKDIKEKKEFLAKTGETLKYTPSSYRVDLRVGTVNESEKILKDYYNELNNYYRLQNESEYRFKYLDESILNDEKYSYSDYLQILEERKQALKNLISGRENTRIDYSSYGFGYRKIQIALKNLESIEIQSLKNYLLATNIVRDPQKFQDELKNRKAILENKINREKEIAKNYKNLLDDYKFNSDVIVPKGIKISMEDNQKEKYYVEIVNDYLLAEKIVVKLQQELKELNYISQNFKMGVENQRIYILESLKNIIRDYNNIVLAVNELEVKENYINNGALVKLASPVEVVSNSKAKLILVVGVIIGLILGILMAFLKNFLHSFRKFKRGITMLLLFGVMGINSYTKELVTLQFTHKEIEVGLNPDKTPFNLNEILIEKFLVKTMGINIEEVKNITIVPKFPKNSIDKVEEKLSLGMKNYIYVPTEYELILTNVKNNEIIKEKIIKEFPTFYLNYYSQNSMSKYNYLKSYGSYKKILRGLNNLIEGLAAEIDLRKNSANTKERFYEYNNLDIELNKIKNILYRDILNYIKSGDIEFDIFLEKIFLNGENKSIILEIESLENKDRVYSNILKNYNLDKQKAFLLESGDISVNTDTGLKEKQYIEILKMRLNNINQQNILKLELYKNEKVIKNLKEQTKEQENIVNKKLLDIQEELSEIINKMVEIELKDYKREYVGSVKIF